MPDGWNAATTGEETGALVDSQTLQGITQWASGFGSSIGMSIALPSTPAANSIIFVFSAIAGDYVIDPGPPEVWRPKSNYGVAGDWLEDGSPALGGLIMDTPAPEESPWITVTTGQPIGYHPNLQDNWARGWGAAWAVNYSGQGRTYSAHWMGPACNMYMIVIEVPRADDTSQSYSLGTSRFDSQPPLDLVFDDGFAGQHMLWLQAFLARPANLEPMWPTGYVAVDAQFFPAPDDGSFAPMNDKLVVMIFWREELVMPADDGLTPQLSDITTYTYTYLSWAGKVRYAGSTDISLAWAAASGIGR